MQLIKQKPWLLTWVPVWLIQGRAYLKQQLAKHASVLGAQFPMHAGLIDFLRSEYENGRPLVLCSGSDRVLVDKVAAQLALPVEVMASDGVANLKGAQKAQALVDRFGLKGFDYAGNAKEDLPVWRQARNAIVVNATAKVQKAAQEHGNVTMVLPKATKAIHVLPRALRVHQWVKNLLIFVPLLASHNILQLELIGQAVLAFLSMSFCASSVYVVNDLSDVESDRRHHSKQRRPFASGELPIPVGLLMAPLLAAGGIALSLMLPPMATAILLCYVLLSAAYTYWLKQKLLADVITLAGLYTLRIIEGGAATSLLVSPWLLMFSLFLFLSLAFIKRVAEMIHLAGTTQHGAAGRGYFVEDTGTLANLGIASGFLSCLVLSLYISSESVRQLYTHPAWLWVLVPLLLFWVSRLWVITMRGAMTDDPIVYLSKDTRTYATIALSIMILMLATSSPVGIPGVLE